MRARASERESIIEQKSEKVQRYEDKVRENERVSGLSEEKNGGRQEVRVRKKIEIETGR